KKRLNFTRNRLLMDSLLAAEGKAATNDAAMKQVYEDASKQISGEQEVHARHILVETEDEAKAVKAELDKGADFAELAKKKSKDPGASDGGDLGFFSKEQMVQKPRSPPSEAPGSLDFFLASSAKSAPLSSSALTALASSSVSTRMWRACTSCSPEICFEASS